MVMHLLILYSEFTTATATSINNPVVAKFKASDGSHIWSAGIGGEETGIFNSVDMPTDGSYAYCAGTTQIWTLTSGKNAGVLIKISGSGTLQWVRKYSVVSTDIEFNKVVVLGDHSSIWTFGNSAGTTGIMVKWTTAGINSGTLSLTLMADITSAKLFVDQSTIIIGGQTSASKMFVGAFKLSDTTLVLDKYFDVTTSSISDISVNSYGQVGIVGSSGTAGAIINFDPDFNDKCTALTITDFTGALTSDSTDISSEETGQTLESIFPTIKSSTITSSTSTTTINAQTCGEV